MKVTEMIDKLQRFQKDHGNVELEMAVRTDKHVWVYATPKSLVYQAPESALLLGKEIEDVRG